MTAARRVVVTGLGVIAGPDCGADAVAATLRGDVMRASVVDDRQGYHTEAASRRAILTRGVDLSPWLPPAIARRMSPPSRLAVVAARMAMAQAADVPGSADDTIGVVMSSSFGPVTSTEALLDAARQFGPQAVSPMAFAESVANAAAGHIAIDTRAQGPNITIVQREAGALTAVGRGAALIRSGRAGRVLAGSVDEMPPILHALLGRFDTLAKPDGAGHEVARPFDRRRNGFVVAEGAVVLVLEDAARAQARGAPVLARISGFGSAFDPTAPRIGWGEGHVELGAAMRRGFAAEGVAPGDITRIVSGASGAVAGDRLEARMLRSAWADTPLPPVLAPKGHLGQYGGGFLAAAVLSVAGGDFGPTPGFAEEDPELRVRPFGGGHLPPAALSLVTTAGSGGSTAWLLVEGP